MIFGIGNDLADIERVGRIYERHGFHFVKNILTPAELEMMKEYRNPAEFIAGRWAAKEAFSKALGTGMCDQCAFVETEILRDERGKPYVRLHAATEETARRLGIVRIHVSISHEKNLAMAMVLLEAADAEG